MDWIIKGVLFVLTIAGITAAPSCSCGNSTGQWCWQVALLNEAGTPFCSAILIDPSFAITAAQCIFGRQPDTTIIRIGARDLSAPDNQSFDANIEALVVHQGYRDSDTRSDFNIGVIKLRTPLDCNNSRVCFACLPDAVGQQKSSQECTTASWNVRATSSSGLLHPPRPLQQRPVAIVPQVSCEAAIQNDSALSGFRLAESKICVNEKQNISNCQGDIGDALICRNGNLTEISGINTIGFSCLRPNVPSFYTRVSAFTEWINKVREQSTFRPIVPVGVPGASTVAPPNLDFAFLTKPQTTTTQPSTTSPTTPLAINAVTVQQSTVKIIQSIGVGKQSIAADGSLSQIAPDGSVQQMKALPQPTVLETVAPGVFKTVNTVTDLFNILAGDGKGHSLLRRKRDSLFSTGTPFASIPVISVSANAINFDPESGRLTFNLPTGLQAVSTIGGFSSGTLEEVRQQIINQQEQVLAKVESLKQNILISVNSSRPSTPSSSAGKSEKPDLVTTSPVNRPQTGLVQAQDPIKPQVQKTVQAANAATAKPASTAVSGNSNSLVGKVVGTAGSLVGGVTGAVNSVLSHGAGSSSAGISFTGDKVSGQTHVAPGSASSSVSASSSGRKKRQALLPGASFEQIPIITIPESAINFDSITGKLIFNLPTGMQAFSTVGGFSSNSLGDIRRQFADQHEQVLAKIEALKQNVLISVGAANANSVAASFAANQAVPSGKAQLSNHQVEPDDDDDDEPAIVTPVRQNVKVSQGPTGVRVAGGPASGSVQSKLNHPSGSSQAAIGFSGKQVAGETRVAPGSAASIVSASSG